LLASRVLRDFRHQPALTRPAIALVALIAAQLALGVGAWVVNFGWPVWFQGYAWAERHVIVQESFRQAIITTAHVANGSLILAVSTMLALRSLRLVQGEARGAVTLKILLGAAA
ncbi:MAG TPA: hypothetical protein VG713_18525, partial [Pirellulales bacterium]|nr:hypothetical protein [Pirellulales bacterium]